jgi:hypothetical protein
VNDLETVALAPHDAAGLADAHVRIAGGQVLGGDKYQAFSREFAESKKPSRLEPDATKFAPAGFSTKDWTFGAGGLFVLPFWAAAIVQGKCN